MRAPDFNIFDSLGNYVKDTDDEKVTPDAVVNLASFPYPEGPQKFNGAFFDTGAQRSVAGKFRLRHTTFP